MLRFWVTFDKGITFIETVFYISIVFIALLFEEYTAN